MKNIYLIAAFLAVAFMSNSALAQTEFTISGTFDSRFSYLNQNNVCINKKTKKAFTTSEDLPAPPYLSAVIQVPVGTWGSTKVSTACDGDNQLGGINDVRFYFDEPSLTFEAYNADLGTLVYGTKVKIILPGEGDLSVVDEASAYISGQWGVFEFGFDDGAEDQLAVNGFVDGGSGNIDGGSPVVAFADSRKSTNARVTSEHIEIEQTQSLTDQGIGTTGPNLVATKIVSGGFAPRSMSIAGDSGDKGKISYYTPNLYGFTLGLSYAPEKIDTSKFDHWLGAGIKYKGNVGAATLSTAFVYGVQITDDKNDGNPMGLKLGANAAINGLNLGLGVAYNINSASAISGPGKCNTKRRLLNPRDTKTQSDCVGSLAFNVSVGYDFGAGSIGGGFLMGVALGAVKPDAIPKPIIPLTDTESAENTANFPEWGATLATSPLIPPNFLEIDEAYKNRNNYGVDTYMSFGLGVDYKVVDGLKVYADFVYSIDNVTTKGDGKEAKEFDSNGIGIVIGSKISM